MSEQLAHSFGQERGLLRERKLLTRRQVLRTLGALGLGAIGAGAGKLAYPPAKMAIKQEVMDLLSIGHDFSNQLFYKEVGAHGIDRARLNELLGPNMDTPVELRQIAREAQADHEALAEYNLTLERDGPVFAEFHGLHSHEDSLAILRASIDHGDEFLVPILRTTAYDRPSVSIQLGTHEKGSHTLELYEQYAAIPIASDEATPSLTQGKAGTLRSFLDMYQPDLYLHDYGDIANNFPWRSYVTVSETDDGLLAVVYTTECLDEDPIFGLIGTSPQRLIKTKGRPTDIDWSTEELLTEEGSLKEVSIDTVYHTRRKLSLNLANRVGPHIPLRLASLNNNLELASDPSLLMMPKVRFRPIPLTDSERYDAVRQTATSAALLSLCENIDEHDIDPNNPQDAAILRRYHLNVQDCKN